MLLSFRYQYPPVSVLDVHLGFPVPVFKIEKNRGSRSTSLICLTLSSVPTAVEGTLPRASHREYRPKRVPERANVGMEWNWPATRGPAERRGNGAVQAQKNRLQRTNLVLRSAPNFVRFLCPAPAAAYEPGKRQGQAEQNNGHLRRRKVVMVGEDDPPDAHGHSD